MIVELDGRVGKWVAQQSGVFRMSPSEFVNDRLRMLDHSRPIADRISDLVLAGMCDSDIAAEVKYSIESVRVVRRALGMKPNRKHARPGS